MKFLPNLLRSLARLLWRFKGFNTEALKTPGPVLLIPNHVSWLDWLFIAVCLDEDWRFVVSEQVSHTSWLHRKIMVNSRTFPIDSTSPYAVKRMAEFLNAGGRLVLFAEGRISKTGSLMKLFDGTGFLLFKTRSKVILCHLRHANRLRWSGHRGWTKWFPQVTAHFSEALTPPHPHDVSTVKARGMLTNWLRDRMVEQQFNVEMAFGAQNLPDAIAESAANQPSFEVLEDVNFQPLTYRKMFVGAELLAGRFTDVEQASRLLAQNKTEKFEKRLEACSTGERIGVLLPNINAMPVLLLGLWKLGKVPAILNFTTGAPVMQQCVQLAGIKRIVTSREFLKRARLDVQPLIDSGVQLIHMEDLREGITGLAKAMTALRLAVLGIPRSALRVKPSATAVILFTSGSEGVPKGVELTHRSILANIRQMLAITDIEDGDRLFNCLPLFHSFGLVVGTLLPMVRGLYVFLYPSPLHYRIVPNATYDRDCTILLSTNTFLNGYARKAHPYDFRRLRYLFAAAEKLQDATAQTWARKFGVPILEGYGATECSPAICLNTPMTPKYGSAGKFLPGIEWKLEPVEGVSEDIAERGAQSAESIDTGRLFVRGPNVMKGYLNPEPNAAFQALGGWYDTGDIVHVDQEGFAHIRGRMKRFAKVSGEMVSLTAVEDALAGAFPQYGMRCTVAVVSQSCEDKGETLIAVSNEPKLQLDEIRAAIRAKGLPNLWVPREARYVREIPKLGTGKVNHRELAKMVSAQ